MVDDDRVDDDIVRRDSRAPLALAFDVGITLRVWDHGGSGPVVVVLHGYLDNGRSFDALADALHPDARVLAVDLRGHGESERCGRGGSYHLLDHVKDIGQLLSKIDDEVGPVQALVGHSMGGNVAMLVAGTVPERVRRLLLVDAVGPPSEDADAQPERIGDMVRSLSSVKAFKSVSSREDAERRVQATNPGLSSIGAARMVKGALFEDRDGGFRFKLDDALRGPVPFRFPESFWSSLIRHTRAPTHVLRAASGYVPDEGVFKDRMTQMGGAVTTLDDVGHHIHVEAPNALADAIRKLLGVRLADTTRAP